MATISNPTSNPNFNYFSSGQGGNPAGLSAPAGTPAPSTPSLSGGGSTNSGLSGAPAMSGDQLNASLNSSFDNSGTASSIMDAYNSQLAANTAGTLSSNKYASGLEQSAEDAQNYEKSISLQDATTASKGLINPGAMSVIQNRSDKILSDLKVNLADAMSNNNTALVKANSDAMATEIGNMTAARTSFLSQYFNTQTEARSEAAFPLTQAATAAATQASLASAASSQATAANITALTPSQIQSNIASAAASTAAAAFSAVQGKQLTALTPSQIEANLAAAGASSAGANASNATAAQTNALTKFLQQGNVSSADPNVQSLLKGGDTPQTIQTKYPVGLYGGYAASIISAAQANGYNELTGTNSGISQSANAASIGGGGVGAFGSSLTNLVGNAGSKIFGNNSGSTPENPFSLAPSTTSGSTYKGYTLPY